MSFGRVGGQAEKHMEHWNLGSGAMSGTAVDFSNFSKIRLWGGRGDPID